jgi:adenylosuccinate synthase
MKAPIVCGLAFGDEGKGSITDFLVRTLGTGAVVRYNGGPQAGHNVVTPDGRWHCFAQFGAGSFVSGVRTVLASDMLVELEALDVEATALADKGVDDVWSRLRIDRACTLVTPMHKLVGQLGELARAPARRGSCGMGVGEAVRWRDEGLHLRVGDLASPHRAFAVLEALTAYAEARSTALLGARPTVEMRDVQRYFRQRCRPRELLARYQAVAARLTIGVVETASAGSIVFEGAQGALLDRTRGFVPYVTQSRSTFHNAAALGGGTKLGVTRAYGHRHGPGPFVTEDTALASHLADGFNTTNRWQGPFRVGWLDLVALRYGVALNDGVDALAVTGLDRLRGLASVRVCTAYEYTGRLTAPDACFQWQRLSAGRARIVAIHASADPTLLTQHLTHCRPLDWIEYAGWDADISRVMSLRDLPHGARRLLDLLVEHLSAPLAIVSVGPTANAKIQVM